MNIGATGSRPTPTGRLTVPSAPAEPPSAMPRHAMADDGGHGAACATQAGRAVADELKSAVGGAFEAPDMDELPMLDASPDEQLLNGLYDEKLGRAPDGEGLMQFSKMISERRAQGMSEPEIRAFVSQEIEKSAEYRQKMGMETMPAPDGMPGAPPVAGVEGASGAKAGQAPYINQYHPDGEGGGYSNGDSNCGPTSMAMVARSFGYGEGMTDAQLIMQLGSMGGTTGDGTGVNGIVAMAAGIGKAGEVRGPGANTEWIAEQLKAGKQVVANGDYYAMGDHNRAKVGAGGHYVAVVGQDAAGNFLVNDPADAKYNPKAFTASELATFISSNTNGGYQVAVG